MAAKSLVRVAQALLQAELALERRRFWRFWGRSESSASKLSPRLAQRSRSWTLVLKAPEICAMKPMVNDFRFATLQAQARESPRIPKNPLGWLRPRRFSVPADRSTPRGTRSPPPSASPRGARFARNLGPGSPPRRTSPEASCPGSPGSLLAPPRKGGLAAWRRARFGQGYLLSVHASPAAWVGD